MAKHFNPAEIPPSPDLRFESRLWESGFLHVAGLDEAGRGAWAGPVAAGAVILPPDASISARLSKVRDSKEMTPAERAYWAEEIKIHSLSWGIGFASNQEIDQMGIVPATRLAMTRALENLLIPPQHLLIDALRLPEIAAPQTSLIKGDARSLSIAAASVLAKTARDAWMVQVDQQYPAYGFFRHKGYGTTVHHAALRIFGPCPIHRFCFAPVKNIDSAQEPANTPDEALSE